MAGCGLTCREKLLRYENVSGMFQEFCHSEEQLLTHFRPMFHLRDKLGNWFLLVKNLKNTLSKSDILSKDVQFIDLHL